MTPAPELAKQNIAYVVHHVEPELYPWSQLEYQHMLSHIQRFDPNGCLYITNCLPPSSQSTNNDDNGLIYTTKPYTDLITDEMENFILLDPEADEVLKPEDAKWVRGIVCGGILGTDEMDGPVV